MKMLGIIRNLLCAHRRPAKDYEVCAHRRLAKEYEVWAEGSAGPDVQIGGKTYQQHATYGPVMAVCLGCGFRRQAKQGDVFQAIAEGSLTPMRRVVREEPLGDRAP